MEAALRIIIVYTVASFQTAYTISNILPFGFLAALIAFTVMLGTRTQRAAASNIDVNGPSAEPRAPSHSFRTGAYYGLSVPVPAVFGTST